MGSNVFIYKNQNGGRLKYLLITSKRMNKFLNGSVKCVRNKGICTFCNSAAIVGILKKLDHTFFG